MARDLVATPFTRGPTATPTVTQNVAYASGQVVGGIMEFPNITRSDQISGILQTLLLTDQSGNNVSYDFFVFNSPPTPQADKAAVNLTAADLAKCVGVVNISGASLGAATTMAVMVAAGLGMAFVAPGTTTKNSLWGVLVTRGAPTYTGTNHVSVTPIVLPD